MLNKRTPNILFLAFKINFDELLLLHWMASLAFKIIIGN